MHGGRTRGQGHRRCPVEHPPDGEVVEVRTASRLAGDMAGQSHDSDADSLVFGVSIWPYIMDAMNLSDEEVMLVETVRAFVDRDVKPTVRDVEHANEYPAAWIEQMKRIGIFGLAVPEEYGGTPVSTRCYVLVTQELARGWMSLAGAMGG